MSLVLLRYLAMSIAPAITATSRPATTFLAVQVTVLLLVEHETAELPGTFDIFVSTPMIAFVAVLALLELVAAHDPDIAALSRELHVDRVAGAFGALSAAVLFAAIGLPEAEAMALVDTDAALFPGSQGLHEAIGAAESSEHSQMIQTGAIGAAVAINLTLGKMRSQLLAFVQDFELTKLWARIETGGVVTALILLPLFPLLILAIAVVFAVVLTIVASATNAAMENLDSRRRTSCSSCDYEVRIEASICPECGTERQPTGEPTTGPKAAWEVWAGSQRRS